MLQDPLAPRRRSRRLWPVVLWGVLVFGLVLVMGGLATYVYLQHQEPPAVPKHDQQQASTPGNGFHRTAYRPKKEDTNGVPAPAPARAPAPAPAAAPAPATARSAPPPAKKSRPKAKLVVLTNESPRPAAPKGPLYTLPSWTYIPCTVENVIVSEVAGYFTVKTTRPSTDRTGRVLIPQGQRIGGKALSADLLFGNERIPTVAVSMTVGDQEVSLGDAVIMDATGTNGLTGKVINHVWRLVWTSILKGGLQGGQQVLQAQLGVDGAGPIAVGIAREGSQVSQHRLGRAQDTRPTIIVSSGEGCQVLTPKALQLPAF